MKNLKATIKKLNKYSQITDEDIENISSETIKKIKKDNQIIYAIKCNSVEDDSGYLSTSDIPYFEYENAVEKISLL